MGFSYNVLSSMIVPLVVVLAIADDVHIMQHWDEERRHGRRRVRVQGDRRAPVRAAARRQRHDGARHAVARDEQRRRGQDVRHRIGGRHHGRLRDLDGAGADDAEPGASRRRPKRRTSGTCSPPLRAGRAVLDARGRGCVFLASVAVGAGRGVLGILRLQRGHEPHQLLQRAPIRSSQSAARDRSRAVRRLQLPDHARGSAGVAAACRTRCSGMDRLAAELRQFPAVAR